MVERGEVTKAVIPAAGLGTRFVPATKATPKEMLPVVDKPAIQYVVEEAAHAGMDDVLLVTGRGKEAIADHFDRAAELESALEAKGDEKALASVRAPEELAAMHYVRQGEPRGLGHAVLCGAQHVGREPFAVLLGDDLLDPGDPLLARMMQVRARYGGSVVALMEVPADQVSRYGCAAFTATGEDDLVRISDLVEKPAPEDAPSRWTIIGRYLLDPTIFDVLRETPPGRGGEIQLTDALLELAKRGTDGGGPVHGVQFRRPRHDTGNKLDYLRTLVRFAADRPDVGEEFVRWLGDFLTEREDGTGRQAGSATAGAGTEAGAP